jgi:competence protein ComEC
MLDLFTESYDAFFIPRKKAAESVIDFIRQLFVMFHISLILKTPLPTARTSAAKDQLIAWNVGQGQWITISTAKTCFHFDMGGERISWPDVIGECGKKQNIAFFSHWDIDHLSFAKKAGLKFEKFCVGAGPNGPSPSSKKSEIFEKLLLCPEIESTKEFQHITELDFQRDQFRKYKSLARRALVKKEILTSNDQSRVFEFQNLALIQGDSPVRQELLWSEKILQPKEIKWIILGHHGSQTSSSSQLLSRLPNLKLAISSARLARYGHPHQKVLMRLKKFGVSCLQTEFWGNIRIEIPH